MKIDMYNFFTNNTVYDLVNEVILKESHNKCASDKKIAELYKSIITNGEKASTLELVKHFLAHVGKYIFVAYYRKNFKKAFLEVQQKTAAQAAKTFPKIKPEAPQIEAPPTLLTADIPVRPTEPATPSVSELRRRFMEKEEPKIELIRPKKKPTVNFKNPEAMKKFIDNLNMTIFTVETKLQLEKPQRERADITRKNASDEEITCALEFLRGKEESSLEFFNLINAMNESSINKLIQKLQTKGEGKELTDIDLLWNIVANREILPSNAPKTQASIGYIFKSLSDEQLKASRECPRFTNAITQPLKAIAIANVINKKQIKILASDLNTADFMYDIIKNLPRDNYFLGKIAAILPYSTEPLQGSLKIIFGSFPAVDDTERNISLIPNLEKLMYHYVEINENTKAELKAKKAKEIAEKAPPAKKFPSPKTNYIVYNVNQSTHPIEDWPEAKFTDFMNELDIIDINQVPNYKDYLENKFDSMDRNSMIKFVQRSVGQFSVDLDKLWKCYNQYTGENDQINARNDRLRIVFSNLTSDQLKRSSINTDFLKLLRKDQDGITSIAAEVFTADQLGLIAEPHHYLVLPEKKESEHELQVRKAINYYLAHKSVACIILKLPRENLEQKIRAVLPHTSPTLANAMKRVLDLNKVVLSSTVDELSKIFYAKLKATLQDPIVNLILELPGHEVMKKNVEKMLA